LWDHEDHEDPADQQESPDRPVCLDLPETMVVLDPWASPAVQDLEVSLDNLENQDQLENRVSEVALEDLEPEDRKDPKAPQDRVERVEYQDPMVVQD